PLLLYNEPTTVIKYCGAPITHTKHSFLHKHRFTQLIHRMAKPRILGELVIVALKARNLPNRELIGKQDPFCVFRIGDAKGKTKTDYRGGQHPVWDFQVNLPVAEGKTRMVVQVFDEDLRKEDLIGEAEIDLAEVLKIGEMDDWFKLTYKGKPAGEIYLELTFYAAVCPFSLSCFLVYINSPIFHSTLTATTYFIYLQGAPQPYPQQQQQQPIRKPIPSPTPPRPYPQQQQQQHYQQPIRKPVSSPTPSHQQKPLHTPSSQNTPPTYPQAYPSKPQAYPSKPQAYPSKPQAYPSTPQAYPPTPQAYPPTPQAYPPTPQAYPPTPQAYPPTPQAQGYPPIPQT
ncbi:C2 domain-containing protein, partial [Jimgerdemannia flammicorona]